MLATMVAAMLAREIVTPMPVVLETSCASSGMISSPSQVAAETGLQLGTTAPAVRAVTPTQHRVPEGTFLRPLPPPGGQPEGQPGDRLGGQPGDRLGGQPGDRRGSHRLPLFRSTTSVLMLATMATAVYAMETVTPMPIVPGSSRAS